MVDSIETSNHGRFLCFPGLSGLSPLLLTERHHEDDVLVPLEGGSREGIETIRRIQLEVVALPRLAEPRNQQS